MSAVGKAQASAENAELYNEHGEFEQRDFALRMAEVWARIATSYAQVTQTDDG